MSDVDEVRKPIHHATRTASFDGRTAADAFAQVARYCADFLTEPAPEVRSVNIEYDRPPSDRVGEPGWEPVCIVSITYDDPRPSRTQAR